MNRYTKSFAISAVFYLFLTVTFLYAFDSDENKKLHAQQTKSTQNVRFTIVQEQKVYKIKEKPKKRVEKIEKKIEKKVLKETQKTKKLKPIEKKTSHKIVKKSEKKIEKKPIQNKQDISKKSLKKKILKQQIKQHKSNQTKKKNDLAEINKKKIAMQKYYTQIKKLINKNKYYPKIAIKRGIEGIVKITFTISPSGNLLSFRIIEGKNIFAKSIQNAVKKSFPFNPPQGLLSKNTTLSLKVAYRLY